MVWGGQKILRDCSVNSTVGEHDYLLMEVELAGGAGMAPTAVEGEEAVAAEENAEDEAAAAPCEDECEARRAFNVAPIKLLNYNN